MELEDYVKAHEFFGQVRSALGMDPQRALEDINDLVNRYSTEPDLISPRDAFRALEHAIYGLRKYSDSDLRKLRDNGYSIILPIDETNLAVPKIIDKLIETLCGEISHDSIEYLRDDHCKYQFAMASKMLKAYAEISRYEAKVDDFRKTMVLMEILRLCGF